MIRLQADQSCRGVLAADQENVDPLRRVGEGLENNFMEIGVGRHFLVIVEDKDGGVPQPLVEIFEIPQGKS